MGEKIRVKTIYGLVDQSNRNPEVYHPCFFPSLYENFTFLHFFHMSDTENTAPQGEETAPEVQAPEVVFSQDGDKVCAFIKGHENLAEDPAGFGDTEDEAKANLFQEIHNAKKPFGVKIFICSMIDEMPHELATASLRSKVPFTKEKIDAFIASNEMTTGLQKAITDDG